MPTAERDTLECVRSARLDARRDRCEEFLAMLFSRFRTELLAKVLHLTNQDRDWADDVVQETFIRAWRHSDTLIAEPSMLRGWLSTVARRIVIDGWRSRAKRPREVELAVAEVADVSDGVEHLLSLMVVTDMLARLTDKHRAAVYETYVRDRTVREAARVLGVPEGTVKSRLHSATREIRQTLRVSVPD